MEHQKERERREEKKKKGASTDARDARSYP